jgi:hypothetical protein
MIIYHNILFSVPPVIAPLSPNEEVEKGKSLSVNCNATGSPTPTVEWSKNDNVLPTSQQVHCLSRKHEKI